MSKAVAVAVAAETCDQGKSLTTDRKTKKPKLTPRLLLRELREMARLEADLCMSDEQQARNVWQQVQLWAEGVAALNKIDLANTMPERVERQRKIFNG